MFDKSKTPHKTSLISPSTPNPIHRTTPPFLYAQRALTALRRHSSPSASSPVSSCLPKITNSVKKQISLSQQQIRIRRNRSPHIPTPVTSRDRCRLSTGRTPARHCCRFQHHELRTRLQVLEALVGADRRCNCGTGVCVCGGRVGGCDAGGEAVGRGRVDSVERHVSEGEGKETVGALV